MSSDVGFYELLGFDADKTLWALDYNPIWGHDHKKPWKLSSDLRGGGTVNEYYASREEAVQAIPQCVKVWL